MQSAERLKLSTKKSIPQQNNPSKKKKKGEIKTFPDQQNGENLFLAELPYKK